MSIKFGSDNIFKDLGFDETESVELKFKAELYVIMKKAIDKKKLTNRELEKIWDVPQPRVSEVMTGKLDKVSITRMLNYLSAIGVSVQPTQKSKRA